MKHDISALEAKLHRLGQSLSQLADAKHAHQLLPMIRRPGFTTPAELLLAVATVDAMQHHVDRLNQSGAALMKGVGQIGKS